MTRIKTSISLDRRIWAELHKQAALKGIRLSKYLEQLLAKELGIRAEQA